MVVKEHYSFSGMIKYVITKTEHRDPTRWGIDVFIKRENQYYWRFNKESLTLTGLLDDLSISYSGAIDIQRMFCYPDA